MNSERKAARRLICVCWISILICTGFILFYKNPNANPERAMSPKMRANLFPPPAKAEPEEILLPEMEKLVEIKVNGLSTNPAVIITNNNNDVPEGYKRIKFTLVGTGFVTKPQTNNQPVKQ